jgi:methyl-accepting chemotaxis protein
MNMSNFKIGTRLSGAFAILLLLLGVVLASALWQLSRIDEAKAIMVGTNYKAKLATPPGAKALPPTACAPSRKPRRTDAAEEKSLDAEMKAVSAQVSKVQDELTGLVTSEKGKENLKHRRRAAQAVHRGPQRDLQAQGRTGRDRREFKASVDETLVPEMKKYLAARRECRRLPGFAVPGRAHPHR